MSQSRNSKKWTFVFAGVLAIGAFWYFADQDTGGGKEESPRTLAAPKEVSSSFPERRLKEGLDFDSDASTLAREPAIEEHDSSKGEYVIRWKGYDGTQKRVIYTRPDTILVNVSASVTRGKSKKYRYTYELSNSSSSAQYLAGFVVQVFDESSKPLVNSGVYIGKMNSDIDEFSEGQWWSYGQNIFGSDIVPGSQVTVELESDNPPQIVNCRVHGGSRKMEGVGEDMPNVLEKSLLGYDAWPQGITLGPTVSTNFPIVSEYIEENFISQLDLMVTHGWISKDIVNRYSLSTVENISYIELLDMARADHLNGDIANEAIQLIEHIGWNK